METEKKFFEASLETLRPDEIRLILERLTPQEILSLCATSTRFSKLCSNQELFRRLLQKFYPYEKYDNSNPKKEFVRIMSERSAYHIGYENYGNLIEDSFGRSIDIMDKYEDQAYFDPATSKIKRSNNSEGRLYFKFKGTEIIPFGTKIWLKILSEFDGMTAMAYRTLKDAIDDFLDEEFDTILFSLLEEFEEQDERSFETLESRALRAYLDTGIYGDERYAKVKNLPQSQLKPFNDFLESKIYHTPFTRENVRNYILKNKFFFAQYNLEHPENNAIFHFIQVQLNDDMAEE